MMSLRAGGGLARAFALPIALLLLCGGCTVSNRSDDDAGPGDARHPVCVAGTTGCDGSTFYTCSAEGSEWLESVECESACHPREGCVACIPGTHRCVGGISERCQPDQSWARVRDCREWGSACGAGGLCEDACAAPEASGSFAGCDFQLVALPAQGQPLSAMVANLGADPNEVEIRREGVLLRSVVLAPRAVQVVSVPDVMAPIGTAIGRGFTARLRSEAPVLVTQFQPFEPIIASADASLLIPRHALGRHHVAASYSPMSWVAQSVAVEPPHEPIGAAGRVRSPGILTVVAPPDEAVTIEVTPTARLRSDTGGRVPVVGPGETLRLTLAPGEAVQLEGAPPPDCSPERESWTQALWCFEDPVLDTRCYESGTCAEPTFDLSGTVVRSDRPVAVFGAHECAFVPYDRPFCDRLEEQLPPVETWGLEHVTMAASSSSRDQLRVFAAYDGTHVQITPAQDATDGATLDAGEWIEVPLSGAVRVVGDRPILVAQYLTGQGTRDDVGPRRGDPSMWFVPPVEQYRDDYAISLPHSYLEDEDGAHFLMIARPRDSWTAIGRVRVEAELTPIGIWEVGVVRVQSGVHEIVGSAPFSLVAIGMSDYTSYATAVGRELRPLLH